MEEDDERPSEDQKKSIVSAIERYINKKMYFRDLHMRHIVWWPGNNKSGETIFIDRGAVQLIRSPNKKMAASLMAKKIFKIDQMNVEIVW